MAVLVFIPIARSTTTMYVHTCILFQGQMELKVKQLEEAQSRLKVKPEAMPNESPHRTGGITRRSLPSTPSEVKCGAKFGKCLN